MWNEGKMNDRNIFFCRKFQNEAETWQQCAVPDSSRLLGTGGAAGAVPFNGNEQHHHHQVECKQ